VHQVVELGDLVACGVKKYMLYEKINEMLNSKQFSG
jgi:hypothetical protein